MIVSHVPKQPSGHIISKPNTPNFLQMSQYPLSQNNRAEIHDSANEPLKNSPNVPTPRNKQATFLTNELSKNSSCLKCPRVPCPKPTRQIYPFQQAQYTKKYSVKLHMTSEMEWPPLWARKSSRLPARQPTYQINFDRLNLYHNVPSSNIPKQTSIYLE